MRSSFALDAYELLIPQRLVARLIEDPRRMRETVGPEFAGVHSAAGGLHVEVTRQRELIGKLDSTLNAWATESG